MSKQGFMNQKLGKRMSRKADLQKAKLSASLMKGAARPSPGNLRRKPG